jgi:hypothetical protein
VTLFSVFQNTVTLCVRFNGMVDPFLNGIKSANAPKVYALSPIKILWDFDVVSGKEKALLPFPSLRTGREIFTSSGSSLY